MFNFFTARFIIEKNACEAATSSKPELFWIVSKARWVRTWNLFCSNHGEAPCSSAEGDPEDDGREWKSVASGVWAAAKVVREDIV